MHPSRGTASSPFLSVFFFLLCLSSTVISGQRSIKLNLVRRRPHELLQMQQRGDIEGTQPITLSPSPQPSPHVDVLSGKSIDLGGYYAEEYVGTPPQRLSLLLDTGSDLTWFKCSPSSTHLLNSSTNFLVDPIFNPNMSSSFHPLPCWSLDCQLISSSPYCRNLITNRCYYNQSYTGLTSTTGYLFYDTFTLNSPPLTHLALGCTTTISGPLLPLSGILGLGQGPLSFISQTQNVFSYKFSYCLADYSSSNSTSSLTLGESHPLASALQYTTLVNNPYVQTFYYVSIEEVRINGSLIDIPVDEWQIDSSGYGGTVVDTGSTLTRLPEMAYETILVAFQTSISYPRANSTDGLELCYNITGVSNPHFPDFSITFAGNATFQPPQDNYFIDVSIDNVKCLGIQATNAMSVIGNLLQQNFQMEFDRVKNLLGFLHTNCSILDS